MTKKIGVFVVLLSLSVILGGCSLGTQSTGEVNEEVLERPVTVLKGKVVKTGTTYSLVSGSKATEITSKKIDLNSFNLKEVEVTGEFSGTTLYVDSIQ